jgi:hypothetical protein
LALLEWARREGIPQQLHRRLHVAAVGQPLDLVDRAVVGDAEDGRDQVVLVGEVVEQHPVTGAQGRRERAEA